jgi:hypothetical protein
MVRKQLHLYQKNLENFKKQLMHKHVLNFAQQKYDTQPA